MSLLLRRPLPPLICLCAPLWLLAPVPGCGGDSSAEADETDEGSDTEDYSGPLFVPPGTVLIPGGNVWRGCLDGDEECDSDESPGGWVGVSAFYIDEYEATTESFEDCVNDGDCTPTDPDNSDCNLNRNDRDDHPINCLTWDMANEYCAWRGLRLPTEAEWERAARADELTLFPWGDSLTDCTRAAVDECTNSTQPSGTFPDGVSPFGVADMAGNVSEWVADYYDNDYYGASAGEANPPGPDRGSRRVIKGSAFTVPLSFPAQRVSKRNAATPETALRIYGVRCARDF